MRGYLENKKWNTVSFAKKESPDSFGKKFLFLLLFVFLISIPLLWQNKETVHNPFREVSKWIIVTDLKKPMIIQTKILSWSDFKNGKLPEGTAISFVPEGEGSKIGTDLTPIQFAVYNAAKSYLSGKTAGDWIFPSRLLNSGKKMTEVVGRRNLSMAFSVVSYDDFAGDVEKSDFFLREPFFENEGMQGIEKGFIRKFADGSERLVKPNDTWIFLRPNVYGTLRHSETDVRLGAPPLKPENALVLAAYTFTDLCDYKTGEWNVNLTRDWVAKQYSIAYGISLNPQAIEIVGKGVNTRFIYSATLPVSKTVILNRSNGSVKEMKVPLLEKSALCFYASEAPTQSIVIPLSYFHEMDKDDTILLGVKGEIKISFQDILDEAQQVRNNRLLTKRSLLYPKEGGDFSDSYLTDYIVRTPRMKKIVDKIVSRAQTKKEAIRRIMEYSAESLAYISDKKTDSSKEIPMPPMMALLNRGEDCEGHAIFAASLFISSTNPIIGNNSLVGLAEIVYVKGRYGIGHVVPLIPGFGTPEIPFPNHILVRGIPFGYFEATGAGYNQLHQLMPQKSGYLPKKVFIIDSRSRKVDVAGFNQFEYLKG